MKTLNYKNHEVTIFEGYDGDEIYITRDGQKVYSARVNKGAAIERMHDILG